MTIDEIQFEHNEIPNVHFKFVFTNSAVRELTITAMKEHGFRISDWSEKTVFNDVSLSSLDGWVKEAIEEAENEAA